MTKSQISYIMNGKTEKDIDLISFTSNSKILPERYKQITIDQTNELIKCEANNGRIEFWDFVDVNGIFFKSENQTKQERHMEILTGSSPT